MSYRGIVIFAVVLIVVKIIMGKGQSAAGAGKGQKKAHGGNLSHQKRGGQNRSEASRSGPSRPNASLPSAKPNISGKKRHQPTKNIPARLARQEEIVTGRSGYIQQDNYKGKRTVAVRLMEGDPVPEGYRGIACHYCGAVNLVKKNSPAKHSCYFCREPID